jgi:hypothetical protein
MRHELEAESGPAIDPHEIAAIFRRAKETR